MHEYGESTEVAVIGAGPAGLAAARCLASSDVPHVVLEQGSTVCSALRRVDPEMRLLSPKRVSTLPGMSMGSEIPTYPSFRSFVALLERYAKANGIEARTDAKVVSVRKKDGVSHLRVEERPLKLSLRAHRRELTLNPCDIVSRKVGSCGRSRCCRNWPIAGPRCAARGPREVQPVSRSRSGGT